MNRDPIFLRVDGNSTKGYERLVRCQILAAALQRRRRPVYFVSQLEPRSLALALKRGGNDWLEGGHGADHLFGGEGELDALFPGSARDDLLSLRHYYHAPAMSKCFGDRQGVEYITAAVARRGGDYALLANTRIQVESKQGGDYAFKEFLVETEADADRIRVVDNYPGFLVDGRKVDLKKPSRCVPYGIPAGCGFDHIGRYRRTPSWLDAGKPLELSCRIQAMGEGCTAAPAPTEVSVGGVCDKEMRPVAGVK